jgi:TolB-like protein
MSDFFDNLKKRKMVQWSVAYVAAAFALLQGIDIVAQRFDWPESIARALIIASVIGFFITLLLAWYHGERGAQKVSGTELLLLALLLAIGGGLMWKFSPYASAPTASSTATDPLVGTADKVDRRSIAVLPFVNMSADPEQEYFSDGMTEELLNVLAKITNLKVAARTSVFEFKGKGGDVREIGRKLGVSHIVEGSVRRDGEQIRVTAQLIRVSDGFHVWSETYDRKIESVFALQDELAKKIGEQLQSSLGSSLMPVARAEIPREAYEEYLKGRALYRSRKNLVQALKHFEATVAKAPNFSDGWATLSLTYEVVRGYVTKDEFAQLGDVFAKSRSAAERAQELAPDSAMTLHALGNVARFESRFINAEQLYQKSIETDPTYPDVREDYAEFLEYMGHFEDSLINARQLVTIEPFVRNFWSCLFYAALELDRRDIANEALAHIRSIEPDYYDAVAGDYYFELVAGRYDKAHAELLKAVKINPVMMANDLALFRWASNEPGVGYDTVDKAFKFNEYSSPSIYAAWRGDLDRVFAYFDSSSTSPKERVRFYELMSKVPARKVLADPRAKTLLREYGFEAYWRKYGWPALCRPKGADDFECLNAQGKK